MFRNKGNPSTGLFATEAPYFIWVFLGLMSTMKFPILEALVNCILHLTRILYYEGNVSRGLLEMRISRP